MIKATIKVTVSDYVKYWEKAVKQSMKQMDYTWQSVPLGVPWWKLWEKEYMEYPMTNTQEYWLVMQTFSPWNEIKGIDFLNKTSVNNSAQIVMSVELYALTRQLAEKYDEGTSNLVDVEDD